jgi:hypothetical protein
MAGYEDKCCQCNNSPVPKIPNHALQMLAIFSGAGNNKRENAVGFI